MADPLVGRKVGSYEIVSLIGHGGMAAVYRAHQSAMKRDVAIKILSDVLVRESNFVARFNREVEVIATLEHPHIVPVYEHGATDGGLLFLAMRLVRGGTLAERIRQGPMPLELIANVLRQVAGALDYAHQRGVIHRDIKPSNVLMDEQDNAYLADFGLAQMVDPTQTAHLTQTGTLVGTPTYLSPEQALEARGDARSDLYSLGVVVYEMITGRPPFSGDTMYNIMRAHISEPPPPALRYRPDLPVSVQEVLEKALAKKPDARYQTATDLAREFTLAVQGLLATPVHLPSETILMPVSKGSITAARPGGRVGIFTVGIVLVVLAGLGLLAAPALFSPHPTPTSPPPITSTRARVAHTATPTFVSMLALLAPESSRPDTGSINTLRPTDQEIRLSRMRLQGSFIGIMACTMETEYHASLVSAARTRAVALGLQVEVADANADSFRQAAILNRFIAEGAKIIVMCPLDNDVVAPAVRAAQDAGIIVVATGDHVFGRASVTLTLTNETMGQAVGSAAAEYVNTHMGGKAKVFVLDYSPLPDVMRRADAMIRVLREIAPGAEIVGRGEGGLSENGRHSMEQALAEHPDIDLIMSINDAGAFGAVEALRAARVAKNAVAIFSVDAEAEARRMIRDGEYFRASLDNDPVGTATAMVDAAVKMLSGAVVPRQVLVSGKMITRESLITPTRGTSATTSPTRAATRTPVDTPAAASTLTPTEAPTVTPRR